MIRKVVVCPERLRRLPRQFSWIDQRLVREGYLQRCDCEALALYLVLVTVSDAQGLSYYGEERLSRCLSLPLPQLQRARTTLVAVGLIAYQAPLYQVLALTSPPPMDRLQRLASLRKIVEAAGD